MSENIVLEYKDLLIFILNHPLHPYAHQAFTE
jgi:hypothetical protein